MKNDNLSSSECYDVFNLYGGKEAILKRADELIRLKLIEKSGDFRKMILEDLMKSGAPEDEEVIEYLNKKTKLNSHIFLAFKQYLNLKVGDALGKLCFANEEIRDYWMNQKHIRPIRVVVVEPLPENPFEGEKGLELYVAFRVIGKFYRAA